MSKTSSQLSVANSLRQDAIKSPIPLCLTPEVEREIVQTIGALPPETGGKLFGPVERFGIDRIEFDEVGSVEATGVAYSPNTEWGNERVEHWLNQDPPRVWTGDVHSHPGGLAHPSGKVGQGLGDLGYLERVFETNEVPQHFALPIILPRTPKNHSVQIAPWIVSRENPLRPMLAEFRVCPVEEFPLRAFNPEWLGRVGEPRAPEFEDSLRSRILDHLLGRGRSDGQSLLIICSRFGTAMLELSVMGRRTRITVDMDPKTSQVRLKVDRGQSAIGSAVRQIVLATTEYINRLDWRRL